MSTSPTGEDPNAEALELLAATRMAHRHAAHVYAKARRENKATAGEELDRAAIMFAMAAAACGARGLK